MSTAVDEALQQARSLVADELKGDLAAARGAADGALETATATGDGGALADASLAVGLVQTLQGDVASAETHLTAALEHAVPERRELARALLVLARRGRLREFPGGSRAISMSAPSFTLRASSPSVLLCACAPIEFSPTPVNDAGRSTVEWWDRASRPLPIELGIRAPQPPERDSFDDPAAVLVGSVLAELPEMREQLDWSGREPLAPPPWESEQRVAQLLPADLAVPEAAGPYIELARADLLHRASNVTAPERLTAALRGYEAADDAVGAGACHLAAADWALGSRASSLAFGHTIAESRFGAGSELPVEYVWSRMFQGAEKDLGAARAALERADACFGDDAPRGLAALELRRAALALSGDGSSFLQIQDMRNAREHVDMARAMFGAAGDRRGEWLAAAHLAILRLDLDVRDAAEDIAHDIGAWGSDEGSFSFALGLGLLLQQIGQRSQFVMIKHDHALAAYRLARVLFERLGAPHNVVQSLADTARLHSQLGDWSQAARCYSSADERGSAVTPTVINDLWLAAYIRQERVASEFVGVMAALGEVEGLKALRERLGSLLEEGRLLVTAARLEPVHEVAVRCKVIENTLLATLDVLIPVRAALASSLPGVRLRHQQRALDAAGDRNDLRAIALEALGSRDEARNAYLRHVDESSTAASAAELGAQVAMLVRLGAWERAVRLLADPRLSGDPEDVPWLARDDLGQFYRHARHDPERALAEFEKEITRIESRRAWLTSDALRVAQTQDPSASRTFIHAARTAFMLAERAESVDERDRLRAQAFDYAERGKSRALLDLMLASRELGLEPARAWREASARLALARELLATRPQPGTAGDALRAQLGAAVDEAEAELARQEVELQRAMPGWQKKVSPVAEVLSLDEVVGRLKPGTLLLQFHFVGREYLAWAISHEGLRRVVSRDMDDVDALPTLIERFEEACKLDDQLLWRTHSARLAEQLLGPFERLIDTHDRLLIVPFGRAHRVPFGALLLDGEPLVQRKTISVLPSASALGLLDDAAETLSAGPVLALGNPEPMPDASAHQVPWLAALAAYVAARWPQDSKRLLGTDATEANLREQITHRFELVLLGTHGFVEENPPNASLALAGAGQGLDLIELLGLDFTHTQLVVLGACATGRGAIGGGDEVMSLTRGLLAAGAHRALVTLESVQAASMPLITSEFFNELKAGESPAKALRNAQEWMIGLTARRARTRFAKLRAAAEDAGYVVAIDAPPEPACGWGHPSHWAWYVLVGT